MPLTEREEHLLRLLDQCLAFLKGRVDVDASELPPFSDEEALVQRRLQLAIQCAIDLGDSLVAKLGLPEPQTAREVFGVLASHNAIARSLVRPLERVTDHGNALNYAYADLKPTDTWRMLGDSLPALVSFAEAVAKQQ